MLETVPAKLNANLLRMDSGPRTWKHYRAWALIRITSKRHAPIWGVQSFPLLWECCPYCQAKQITVLLPLLDCPATARYYGYLRGAWDLPLPTDRTACVLALFGHMDDMALLADVVAFVGRAIEGIIGRSFTDDRTVGDDSAGKMDEERQAALLDILLAVDDLVKCPLDARWDEPAQ